MLNTSIEITGDTAVIDYEGRVKRRSSEDPDSANLFPQLDPSSSLWPLVPGVNSVKLHGWRGTVASPWPTSITLAM